MRNINRLNNLLGNNNNNNDNNDNDNNNTNTNTNTNNNNNNTNNNTNTNNTNNNNTNIKNSILKNAVKNPNPVHIIAAAGPYSKKHNLDMVCLQKVLLFSNIYNIQR